MPSTSTRLPTDRWLPISIAPENCDLQVATIGKKGIQPFEFPCRKYHSNWFNVWAGEPVLIHPIYWRVWREA